MTTELKWPAELMFTSAVRLVMAGPVFVGYLERLIINTVLTLPVQRIRKFKLTKEHVVIDFLC